MSYGKQHHHEQLQSYVKRRRSQRNQRHPRTGHRQPHRTCQNRSNNETGQINQKSLQQQQARYQ